DFAVAALFGLGPVYPALLEVSVGRVRSATEAEVGAGGPTRLDSGQVLADPAVGAVRDRGDDLVQRPVEHVARGEVAVPGIGEPGELGRQEHHAAVVPDR